MEEPRAGLGQGAFDDAPVVGAVATFDQPVPLDTGDEPGGCGRADVEDLGDPAHRLWAVTEEQEEQADLAEREVPGGDRRDVPRHHVERAEHRFGGLGQRFVAGG